MERTTTLLTPHAENQSDLAVPYRDCAEIYILVSIDTHTKFDYSFLGMSTHSQINCKCNQASRRSTNESYLAQYISGCAAYITDDSYSKVASYIHAKGRNEISM